MRLVLANSEGGVGIAAAAEALQRDRPALDAVERGIRPVEADPQVRSVGVGSWPNLLGQIELDAAIMDGRTLRSGAVGALRGFLHPISVARQVMEQLPHVLLVGEGASRFADECGAERGETVTEASRTGWQDWLHKYVPPEVQARWPDVPLAEWARLSADPERAGGTTTFLAIDREGDIAAGVSTCGWAQKYPGRLGDSPIIGAGSYADNRYGAAACTGMGEMAIRAGTARAVVLYMKMGMTVGEACREAMKDLRDLKVSPVTGHVTVHAIDAQGTPFVITTWPEREITYWFWCEGMDAPEQRRAIAATQ